MPVVQVHWWRLVTRVACGLMTPRLSSGVSTRCGSGCSRSWTSTRLMPPLFPSKTLTWTAIIFAVWVTLTSSVLPAAWDTFFSTASQSSSQAVGLGARVRGVGGANMKMITSNKRQARDSQVVWSVFKKGSENRFKASLQAVAKEHLKWRRQWVLFCFFAGEWISNKEQCEVKNEELRLHFFNKSSKGNFSLICWYRYCTCKVCCGWGCWVVNKTSMLHFIFHLTMKARSLPEDLAQQV